MHEQIKDKETEGKYRVISKKNNKNKNQNQTEFQLII